MKELTQFVEWLALLGPSLVELFTKTEGNVGKARRALKVAYEAIDREQAAELFRQRRRTKAKGEP